MPTYDATIKVLGEALNGAAEAKTTRPPELPMRTRSAGPWQARCAAGWADPWSQRQGGLP